MLSGIISFAKDIIAFVGGHYGSIFTVLMALIVDLTKVAPSLANNPIVKLVNSVLQFLASVFTKSSDPAPVASSSDSAK